MEIKESVKGRSKKQWVMELVLMHSEELCAFVDAYSTVNLFDGAFIFFLMVHLFSLSMPTLLCFFFAM